MNLLIAENKGFSEQALDVLKTEMTVAAGDLSRRELLAALPEYDALWVRLRHRIDAEVLGAAPRLKAIATNATGLNHIDLDETSRRSVAVLSLRGETEFLQDIRATAELTMGLMLSLLRKIPAAARHAAAGQWERSALQGCELHEKTVGIVGYGRLGRIVARYLHAFDARVLATPSPEAGDGFAETAPLDELLRRSDIVSIHVDLNDSTRGMFDAHRLRQMKDGAWLVNTARGEVIDEAALLEALQSGKLAGAALDVLADEHKLPDARRPLVAYARTHDNLILTPHVGGYTGESLEKTEIFLANKLVAWARSQAGAAKSARAAVE